MSYLVVIQEGVEVPVTRLPLMSEVNIWVHPLSIAIVPHAVALKRADRDTTLAMVVPIALSPKPVGLLVLGGLVTEHILLSTEVFNLSSKPIKIKRGQVVSHLVAISTGEDEIGDHE